jgi:hypothetical protein
VRLSLSDDVLTNLSAVWQWNSIRELGAFYDYTIYVKFSEYDLIDPEASSNSECEDTVSRGARYHGSLASDYNLDDFDSSSFPKSDG